MIFLTADTHFSHEGIIKHAQRGFASVEEMNRSLVEKWNEVVLRERDEVWVLGDFAFARKGFDLHELFWALRGVKHLVVGNHDETNPAVLRLPWESVQHLKMLKAPGGDGRAVLCHYPMESWSQSHHGALHFHGHSHGTMRKAPRRFDVGWDVWKRPVPFDELLELGLKETWFPTDHHGA